MLDTLKLYNKSIFIFIFITLVAFVMTQDVTAVSELDVERYIGKWHEIARLPNFFQRKCIDGGCAQYAALAESMISVRNSCPTNTKEAVANGVAWRPSEDEPAKLKVSFAPFAKYFKWFSGDYWVLDVSEDYKYAVVGEPGRRFLWFLSKDETVPESVYQRYVEVAKANGYDLSNLIDYRKKRTEEY